jgi:acetylornithine deacetylase/succinyl-diaminopimelate desuccinylase-like protein
MIFEPFPNRPQVVAVVRGKEAGRTLILNGHMDVVPEGSRSHWTYDPYDGVVEGGRIYGRGSWMILAKILHREGFPRGEVICQFVIGEETGEPGTKTSYLERESEETMESFLSLPH